MSPKISILWNGIQYYGQGWGKFDPYLFSGPERCFCLFVGLPNLGEGDRKHGEAIRVVLEERFRLKKLGGRHDEFITSVDLGTR